jgi:sirohydrochlorin ferrochelatase
MDRRWAGDDVRMGVTLLAHGSPDPRHAHDVASLSGRLKVAGIGTQVAYLDHGTPAPAEAARALAASGATATTVVPVFLSPAHSARVDVPAAISAMRTAAPDLALATADPVGLHPLLLAGAVELITAAELPIGPRTGVILASGGWRDPRTVATIEALVREHGPELAARLGARSVRAAYLDGTRPLGRIRTLMRCIDGCTSFVVVPLVLADGTLRDRIVTAATRLDLPVAPGTLARTDALADLVVLRAGSAPAPERRASARAAR